MTALPQPGKVTADEYLRFEQAADERHEYLDGIIVAMAGGTLRHNRIAGNAMVALSQHLRGRPGEVYMVDLRLHVAAANAYFYPDVMVVFAEDDTADGRTHFDDARLVIEVLSEGTEAKDRGTKLHAYRQLPGLQEYVLVAQDGQRVEVFRRRDIGWLYLEFNAGEAVELASVGLTLPIGQLYERTDVPAEGPPTASDAPRA